MFEVRWGILGPGRIARKFAEGLKAVDGARLVAVGSRDAARAGAFAAEFGAARAYGSYEQLAADPEVDAVYVASPHSGHCEHTLLCLNAGKAVLCEKPLAINEREARRMVEAARARDIFLMEAMWMRFMPVHARVREWIRGGAIGDPRMARAEFGFRGPDDPESRLLNPALGGGGLLDVGIYPLSFIFMALGSEPEAVAGFADIGRTGVDEQAVAVLKFGGGRLGHLSCGVRTLTAHSARVYGSEGMIEICPPFWQSKRVVLRRSNGKEEVFESPHRANGYEYEAMEVGRCLEAGLKESPLMPLDESLALMRAMDTLREQWGLKYPMEAAGK